MYTALSAASETLADYLEAQLTAEISFFATGAMVVTLNNPQEMEESGRDGVSVWLYRVVRDEERLNGARERLGPSRLAHAPLPLRLHYLVTPVVGLDTTSSPTTEQTVLGRVLQALHDRPVLRGADLRGALAGTDAKITARLEPIGLDQIARVWEAIDRSYQLSVSYEVGVVYIESDREAGVVAPVEVAESEWGTIVDSEPT